MRVMYLGGAGALVEFGDGVHVAFDPLRDSYKLFTENTRDLKAVFITHEHKTHFDKGMIEDLYKRYGCYVVGPSNLMRALSIPSQYKNDAAIGDIFDLEDLEIHVLAPFHPQSEYAVAYLVKHRGERVFYPGDTYENDTLYKVDADLAFLPIRGMETMAAPQAARIALKMKVRKVMPIYWENKKDVDEFLLTAKDRALPPIRGQWVDVR